MNLSWKWIQNVMALLSMNGWAVLSVELTGMLLVDVKGMLVVAELLVQGQA
jgi:hypothetical protein